MLHLKSVYFVFIIAGATGLPGNPGLTGIQGAQGLPGNPGVAGAFGATGFQGAYTHFLTHILNLKLIHMFYCILYIQCSCMLFSTI